MGIIIIVIIAFIIIKFIGLMLTGVAGVVGTSYAVGKTINERNLQQRMYDFLTDKTVDTDYVNLGGTFFKKLIVNELDIVQETEKVNIKINEIKLMNVITQKNCVFYLIDDTQLNLVPNVLYNRFCIDLTIENKSNEIVNINHNQALAVNNLQQQSLTTLATKECSQSIMPNARINVIYDFIFKSAGEDIKEIKIFIPTINEYITINLEELK